MTQYSYETLPTIDISPFDVKYYPLYSNTIEPFVLDTKVEEAVMAEDPIQSRMRYWEMELEPIIHIITPTGNDEVIELVKEPRFNPDEVIAFIEGGDGA